jgi:ribosomal protein S17
MAEKGVLSARGERVDFDLMKIKQQIAAAPKAVTVKAREDFIDQKFKRRLNRQTKEVVAKAIEEKVATIEDQVIDTPTTPEEE